MESINQAIIEQLEKKEKYVIQCFKELLDSGVIWIESDTPKVENTSIGSMVIRENIRFCFDGQKVIEELKKENEELKKQIESLKNCYNCFNAEFDYGENYCKKKEHSSYEKNDYMLCKNWEVINERS